MKVFILFSVVDKPFGGSNQFMRALKHFFLEKGMLARTIWEADAVLLNSHTLGGRHGNVFPLAYALKVLFPRKIFVHRIDGPIQLYGGTERAETDRKIYQLNAAIVDGTIFQSDWIRRENKRFGLPDNHYEVILPNAADPAFFFPPHRHEIGKRTRLIASAWSNHPNKGFDIYEELDRHLDWSRFVMTFVGRTPQPFTNIAVHPPVSSPELGALLREHDVYVAASRNDPCSNALLEALACGLPAVARNSGGHPELVGRGGELFDDARSATTAIERVAKGLDSYRSRIHVKSMAEVGAGYLDFIERIVKDRHRGRHVPKRMSWLAAGRQIIGR